MVWLYASPTSAAGSADGVSAMPVVDVTSVNVTAVAV